METHICRYDCDWCCVRTKKYMFRDFSIAPPEQYLLFHIESVDRIWAVGAIKE